jgi:hypothetical protein
MNIGSRRIDQQFLRIGSYIVWANDLPGPVNDPIVTIVASHYASFAIKTDFWNGFMVAVWIAGRSMQEYRSDFRVRLHLSERAIGKDQIGFARRHRA